MCGAYCYLPILPARGGAFRAVSALSPDAQSRLTPLFSIPAPAPKDEKALEAYLARRAAGTMGPESNFEPMLSGGARGGPLPPRM